MRDIYVYDGTDVLINKFDERNGDELLKIEANYTSAALAELTENPIKGDFDEYHLQMIHKKIFCDLFDWAGEFRKINIEKPEVPLNGLSVQYSDVFDIRKDLNAIFIRMHNENWNVNKTQNVDLFCKYLADTWRVHPFREGNTRTTMYFYYEYMDSLGIRLDTELLSKNAEYVRTALVAATFEMDGVCKRNMQYLKNIVKDAMDY